MVIHPTKTLHVGLFNLEAVSRCCVDLTSKVTNAVFITGDACWYKTHAYEGLCHSSGRA